MTTRKYQISIDGRGLDQLEIVQMNHGATQKNKLMERSFAIRLLALLTLIQAVTGARVAHATTIQINLGSPGALSSGLVVPFNEINSTSLSGQNLSLDFVFSGNEFVRLFSVTTDFGVSVNLQTNSPGSPGDLSGTGFLKDQLGNPLQPPQEIGAAHSGGLISSVLFPLFPGSGAPNRPFDFYEVHFDLTLPTNPSFEITGAEFDLSAFGLSGPFGIGPGVPNDIVPDAVDAISLLGIGLAGLLIARFKFA